jgi:hypothetical protein
VAVFETRDFDHLLDLVFGDGASGVAEAFLIQVLECGRMAAFFNGHVPEDAGDLERFDVAELDEHFSEAVVHLRVALFNEDRDVQRFLRVQR